MNNLKKYPIEDLSFGLVDEKRKVAFIDNDGMYHNVFPTSQIVNQKFNDKFKYISSFKEILKQYGFDILLVDKNGNQKQYLSLNEIKYLLDILERKLSMSQIMAQRCMVVSGNIVNITSDLLGLNISTPATPFKFQKEFDINEILVSAKKLKLFKKYLFDYINASLIAEKKIRLVFEVGARDYRIARSLNKAKIIQSSRLNQNIFSVEANLEGQIKVNDVDVKEYRQEKEFQKIIKF